MTEICVLKTDELADGEKRLCEVDDKLVLVFRIAEQFFCIDDICTHDGGTLADGEHEGYEIACPRHGARFDIRTGKPLSMPATQPTKVYECRVDGDQVMITI